MRSGHLLRPLARRRIPWSQPLSSRNAQIDTLRGLACVLLVVHHVIGESPDSGLHVSMQSGWRSADDLLLFVRMPLFAFLSGLVYAQRPFDGQWVRFLSGKTRRLLVPMLIVGTVFAVLQNITPGSSARVTHWSTLHIIPVGHYWFLESLFLVFLAVAALEWLELLNRERLLWLAWLVSVALQVWDPMPVYLGLKGATYLLPYFLLGLWICRFGSIHAEKLVVSTAFAIGVTTVVWIAVSAHVPPLRESIAATAIGACVCVLLRSTRWSFEPLARIGTYSFAIFLFHSMFSAASRIVLVHSGVSALWQLLAVGVTLGLLGPVLVELLLATVPRLHRLLLGVIPQRVSP